MWGLEILQSFDYDLVFIGSGLANSLLALRVQTLNPGCRLLLIDQSPDLRRSQTWSFHETDLSQQLGKSGLKWLADFHPYSWDGYEVRFPRLQRQLSGRYYALRGEPFRQVIMERLGDQLLLGRCVTAIKGHRISLESGGELSARLIVDGRGWCDRGQLPCGYQKFLGQLVELAEPSRISTPIIMDATVAQKEGFRFIYTLPFSDRRLLIEDTRYSLDPQIDKEQFRQEIAEYALVRGWKIAGIHDEEQGCLPIPFRSVWTPPEDHPQRIFSGLAAGHFHPVTGYSFAMAMRFADWAAQELTATSKEDWDTTRFAEYSRQHWQSGGFYRRLNNMLFLAAAPQERYRVLQKFYNLDDQLISRFYAQQLTWTDRLKILSGKAPVPIFKGLTAFFRNLGVQHDFDQKRVVGLSR